MKMARLSSTETDLVRLLFKAKDAVTDEIVVLALNRILGPREGNGLPAKNSGVYSFEQEVGTDKNNDPVVEVTKKSTGNRTPWCGRFYDPSSAADRNNVKENVKTLLTCSPPGSLVFSDEGKLVKTIIDTLTQLKTTFRPCLKLDQPRGPPLQHRKKKGPARLEVFLAQGPSAAESKNHRSLGQCARWRWLCQRRKCFSTALQPVPQFHRSGSPVECFTQRAWLRLSRT